MLKSINLHNFALIEKLELQFDQGLHLLSGDTGAGKSLLFDAMHLLAGQKSDGIWVRDGALKTDIRCEFELNPASLADQALLAKLQEYELQDDDQPQRLHLRRVIHKDGKSKAQVNGVPVKASILKQLTQDCFLFHDQHESTELLKREIQLSWLDTVGGHHQLVLQYQQHYSAWQSLLKEQKKLAELSRIAAQRQDYLAFQLEEMVHLNLDPDHLVQLEARLKLQDHAARWQAQANTLIEIIGGDNDHLRALRAWVQQLNQDREPHPKCVAAQALIETALIHLDEAEQEVLALESDMDVDEELLGEAQQVLAKVFELSRKHQVPVGELLQFRDSIDAELAQIEVDETRLNAIAQEVLVVQEQVQVTGLQLRTAREAAALQLIQLLTNALVELGMPATQWEIQITPTNEPKAQGLDEVQFLMSSNQGHKPQPLGKIASGGELSRISLVLHAFARSGTDQKSQVYCFDEVDVGVSGTVAAAIGALLQRLSQKNQVFCISHAPQVTAQPGTHWRAQKQLGAGQQIATQWTQLAQAERVEEIARMLGTASKPELTLAKKLLQSQRKPALAKQVLHLDCES